MKRPYYLKRRGDFWYYRLNPESGLVVGENLNYCTTGCRTRAAAEAFMADLLGLDRETPTFRQYAEPFFIWGICPHIRRVLEETGHFTHRHARIQRGRLENHLFTDPIAFKRISEITRADIFDLRSRLLERCSPATTNKVIDIVKIVLREAVLREEISSDPTELVRRVRQKKRTRDIFTVEELRRLFPEIVIYERRRRFLLLFPCQQFRIGSIGGKGGNGGDGGDAYHEREKRRYTGKAGCGGEAGNGGDGGNIYVYYSGRSDCLDLLSIESLEGRCGSSGTDGRGNSKSEDSSGVRLIFDIVGALASIDSDSGPHDGEPGSISYYSQDGLDSLFQTVKHPAFNHDRLRE